MFVTFEAHQYVKILSFEIVEKKKKHSKIQSNTIIQQFNEMIQLMYHRQHISLSQDHQKLCKHQIVELVSAVHHQKHMKPKLLNQLCHNENVNEKCESLKHIMNRIQDTANLHQIILYKIEVDRFHQLHHQQQHTIVAIQKKCKISMKRKQKTNFCFCFCSVIYSIEQHNNFTLHM